MLIRHKHTFTKKELDALLDGCANADANHEQQKAIAIQSAQGPGYLNKWRLLEGTDSPWERQEFAQTQTRRRKVILSNFVHAGYGLTDWDIFLIASLIEHCDVYLFPKKRVPMSAVERVTSLEQFFQQRSQIRIASKAYVQRILAEQGIRLTEYDVLDIFEIQKILLKLNVDDVNQSMSRIEADYSSAQQGEYLDLYTAGDMLTEDQLTETFEDGIDYARLKVVALRRIFQIENLPKWHPKCVYVHSETTEDLEDYKHYGIEKLVLGELKDSSRAVDGTRGVPTFYPPPFNNLKELTIRNSELELIDLSQCISLEVIKIYDSNALKKLILPQKTKLTELLVCTCPALDEIDRNTVVEFDSVDFDGYDQNNTLFDFSGIQRINHLSFKNCKLTSLSLAHLPIKQFELEELKSGSSKNCVALPSRGTLESLTIMYPPLQMDCDAETFVNLKKLKINIGIQTALKLFNNFSLPALQTLDLNIHDLTFNLTTQPSRAVKIDLSRSTKLKELKVGWARLVGETYLPPVIFDKLTVDKFTGVMHYGEKLRVKQLVCSGLRFLSLIRANQIDAALLNDLSILDNNSALPNPMKVSLNLQAFVNLLSLTIRGNYYQSIQFPQADSLTQMMVEVPDASFKCVDVSGCRNLIYLKLDAPNVKALVFSPHSAPSFLDLRASTDCQVTGLDKAKLAILRLGSVSKHLLKSLSCPSLRYFKNDCDFLAVNPMPLVDYFPNLTAFEGVGESNYTFDKLDKLISVTFNYQGRIIPDYFPSGVEQAEVLRIESSDLEVIPEFSIPARTRALYLSYTDVQQLDWVSFPKLMSLCVNDCENFDVDDIPQYLRMEGYRFDVNISSLQTRQPQDRFVSCYRPRRQLGIDGDTGVSSDTYQAEGEIYTELFAGGRISIDHQRIDFFDGFLYQDGKLKVCHLDIEVQQKTLCDELIVPFDQALVNACRRSAARKDNHMALGHLWGRIAPNRWYVLPLHQSGIHAADNKLVIKEGHHANLQLVWIELLKTYAIKFTSDEVIDQNELNIDIYYFVRYNADYRERLISDPLVNPVSEIRLLPVELYDPLLELVRRHPVLHVILDLSVPLKDRIRIAQECCSHFKEEKLTAGEEFDITILLRIIAEGKGVCRHRAIVFLALMMLIGVYALITTNEIHAYCDLAYHLGANMDWLAIDMGGGEINDITDDHALAARLDEESEEDEVEVDLTDDSAQALIQAIDLPDISDAKKQVEEEYQKYFDDIASRATVSDVKQLFAEGEMPPFVILENTEQVYLADNLLVNYCFGEIPYLYIDSPSELKQFYESKSFYQGKMIKNCDYGVLSTALQRPGVIAINLTTFSASQIGAIKCCFDTVRRLFNISAHQDLRFVFFGVKETPVCSALLSRCRQVKLSSELLRPLIQQREPTDSVTEITLDLFNRSTWRELVYGSVNCKDSQYIYEPSLLIQAMCSQQVDDIHVTFYNVPESRELSTLIHRLQVHQSLYCNGLMIQSGRFVTVNTLSQPHLSQAENLQMTSDAIPADKEKITLGMHNLHSLYSQLVVNPVTGLANDEVGLLATYHPERQVFYLLNELPSQELAYLSHVVATQYPEKPFVFVLAPRVCSPNIYISDEPDASAELMCADNSLAISIPVTTATTFADLIFAIRIDEVEGSARFTTQTNDIIYLLNRPNSMVVLTGNISPSLLCELLTLLNEGYYLNGAGERQNIVGTLKLILPMNHGLAVDIIDDHVLAVNMNCPQIIKDFYQLANLALVAQGQPSLPQSFPLLRAMTRRISKPLLHSHNPIKGLLHLQFPVESDQYAILNIIAKYLFASADDKSINHDRLSRVINQLKEDDELDLDRYIYRILNCFSGAALRYIVGDDITLIFNKDCVPDSIKQRLVDLVKRFYTDNPKQTDKNAKLLQQLLALLYDENSLLILLKGPPGVGKSFAMRKLPELDPSIVLCEGLAAYDQWKAKPEPGKRHILFLDEASMEQPGTWEFLKGLCLDKRVVMRQGSLTQLSENHFIVAVDNPSDFPDRYVHSFFQHYGETVYAKRVGKDFLLRNVIVKLTTQNPVNSYHACDLLYAVYELYIKYQPYRAVSIRELEAVTSRYCGLVRALAHTNPDYVSKLDKTLYEACAAEFVHAISDSAQRAEFLIAMNQLFANKMIYEVWDEELTLHEYLPNYFLVTSVYRIANIIAQDILLASRDDNLCKRGILMEGESGLGKTKFF